MVVKLEQNPSLVQGRLREFSTQKNPILGSIPERSTPGYIAQTLIPELYRDAATTATQFFALGLNLTFDGVGLILNQHYTVGISYNASTTIAVFQFFFLVDISSSNMVIRATDNNGLNIRTNSRRTWDGSFGSSRRRNLQQRAAQQLPITSTIFANVSNFRAMKRISDKDRDDTQNGGSIFTWAVFLFKVVGLIICLFQLWYNPRIRALNQYLRFGVASSFLVKIPYLNLGYGSYLIHFMDYTILWDFNLMMSLRNEDNIRPEMKGKLEEYFVPILIFNSIPIQLGIYILLSTLHIIFSVVFKNDKKKAKIVRGIPILILGIILLDLVFYSQVSLFWQPFGHSKEPIPVIISWALCLLVIGLVSFQLISIFRNFFVYKIRHRNRGRSVYNKIRIRMEKESARSQLFKFFNVLEPLTKKINDTIKKGDIFSILTIAKITQILVYSTLILHLQDRPEGTLISIFAIEFLYLLAMIFYIFLFSFFYRSFIKLLFQLVLECFFLSLFLYLSFFESNPNDPDYLYGADKKYQTGVMFLIWTYLLGEFGYFILASFHGVRRRGFLTFAANIRRQYDLMQPAKQKKNSKKPSKKSIKELIDSKAGSQNKLNLLTLVSSERKTTEKNEPSLLLGKNPEAPRMKKKDYVNLNSARDGEESQTKTQIMPSSVEKEEEKETRLTK